MLPSSMSTTSCSVMTATRRIICALTMALALCSCGEGANVIVGNTADGNVNLRLEDTAQSNVEPHHVPATGFGLDLNDPVTSQLILFVDGYVVTGREFFGGEGGTAHQMWQIALMIQGPVTAGGSYPLVPGVPLMIGAPLPSGTSLLTFEEDDRYAQWQATGGTIATPTFTGGQATFELTAVTLAPSQGVATGQLTVSGEITFTGIRIVPAGGP